MAPDMSKMPSDPPPPRGGGGGGVTWMFACSMDMGPWLEVAVGNETI